MVRFRSLHAQRNLYYTAKMFVMNLRAGLVCSILATSCVFAQQTAQSQGPYTPVNSDFIAVYKADSVNMSRERQADYLGWVRQFYNGTWGWEGWTNAESRALDRLVPARKAKFMRRLDRLGFLVAAEWSKDNNSRRIDTNNQLKTWGYKLDSAIRMENGSGQALGNVVTQVENEVATLLKTGPQIPLPKALQDNQGGG